MFPKHWHHGHSLGVGVLVGLLVSRRPELVFAAGFVTAVAAIGFLSLGRTLLGAFEAWRAQSRAKREAIRTRPSAVYSTRRQSDTIPFE